MRGPVGVGDEEQHGGDGTTRISTSSSSTKYAAQKLRTPFVLADKNWNRVRGLQMDKGSFWNG